MSLPEPAPLHGRPLFLAGFALALANFVVVLDIAITAVSVPHIAGGLAISPSQATWTITSYAVAEAISVPLTGWLAARFGTVRLFILSLLGFGLFSLWCGLSQTLGMLIVGRVFQGLAGGPLMPLSQTLMMRIFSKEQQPIALGLWAITTVVAPVLGPVLGGQISDNWSWPWIFFINIPVVLWAVYVIARNLPPFETPKIKAPVDLMGLFLLISWVGAFQLMLDLGQEHGWFDSGMIVALLIFAIVMFCIFIIWEWTEPHPMVDVRMVRYRGFTFATLALSLAFAGFFSLVVLVPLWLQQVMSYSASEAGNVMAFLGLLAVIAAPVAARLMGKVDLRITVCCAILWMGCMSIMRSFWTTETDFWTLALPQLLQGMAIPFFFMGTTALALGSVPPSMVTSAAGLMSFLRTIAGAIATALVTSSWIEGTRASRSDLASSLNGTSDALAKMQAAGMTEGQARAALERMVEVQASTVAVSQLYMALAMLFIVAAASVWLVPKLKVGAAPTQMH